MASVENMRWNPEVALPDSVTQDEMQALISAYFVVIDSLRRIDHVEKKTRSRWLENAASSLDSFEARAEQDMGLYAKRFPASRWALNVVPRWAAAGMAAGIRPDADIQKPNVLWMFCGLEPRHYPSLQSVRDAFEEIIGTTPDGQITRDQIRQLANRIDRRMFTGDNPTKQELFLWATKRRHSEFLRTVAFRLGLWIEREKSNAYYPTYEQALEKEAQQCLDSGRGSILVEIQAYAQRASVRQFLTDFYAVLKKDRVAEAGG